MLFCFGKIPTSAQLLEFPHDSDITTRGEGDTLLSAKMYIYHAIRTYYLTVKLGF